MKRAPELVPLSRDHQHALLHALGERVDAHVRHEERRLFPAVERLLAPEALTGLAPALAH